MAQRCKRFTAVGKQCGHSTSKASGDCGRHKEDPKTAMSAASITTSLRCTCADCDEPSCDDNGRCETCSHSGCTTEGHDVMYCNKYGYENRIKTVNPLPKPIFRKMHTSSIIRCTCDNCGDRSYDDNGRCETCSHAGCTVEGAAVMKCHKADYEARIRKRRYRPVLRRTTMNVVHEIISQESCLCVPNCNRLVADEFSDMCSECEYEYQCTSTRSYCG